MVAILPTGLLPYMPLIQAASHSLTQVGSPPWAIFHSGRHASEVPGRNQALRRVLRKPPLCARKRLVCLRRHRFPRRLTLVGTRFAKPTNEAFATRFQTDCRYLGE